MYHMLYKIFSIAYPFTLYSMTVMFDIACDVLYMECHCLDTYWFCDVLPQTDLYCHVFRDDVEV